jgi:hypothetical protein
MTLSEIRTLRIQVKLINPPFPSASSCHAALFMATDFQPSVSSFLLFAIAGVDLNLKTLLESFNRFNSSRGFAHVIGR